MANRVFSPASELALLSIMRNGATGDLLQKLSALPPMCYPMTGTVFFKEIPPRNFIEQVIACGLSAATLGSAKEMNAVISEQTKGEISGFFDKEMPDATMIIVACVYFKGTWLNKFTKFGIRYPFKLRDGSELGANFMYSTQNNVRMNKLINTAANGKFSAIDIPYNDSKTFMRIAVFLSGQSQITEADWLEIDTNLQQKAEKVEVFMPIWKSVYRTSLTAKLANSFPEMFVPGSLDGIFKDAYVSDASQMTTIDVSLEGTVAASASAATLTKSLSKNVSFSADRQFAYRIITDGGVLFEGMMDVPDEFKND